jgi:hypothetical protein
MVLSREPTPVTKGSFVSYTVDKSEKEQTLVSGVAFKKVEEP